MEDLSDLVEEANQLVQDGDKIMNNAENVVNDTKKLSVRVRDFVLRIMLKLCVCKGSKSSCCDKIENHNETIINYNATKKDRSVHKGIPKNKSF